MRDLGPASFESIILHFFKLPIYIILIWKENYLNFLELPVSQRVGMRYYFSIISVQTTKKQTFADIGHSGLLVKESRLKECACLGDIQVTFIFKEKETEN